MGAGRPRQADPGTLYAVAHQLYWDFRRLAEGRPRQFLDKRKREQLEKGADKANLRLNRARKARLEEMVDEEIRLGRLDPIEKARWLRDVEDGELRLRRQHLHQRLVERFTKHLKFRAELEVLETLLNRKTSPEQVREICKDAFVSRRVEVEPGVIKEVDGFPNWPIAAGSVLPGYLSQYAEQYVAALRDPRFPRCAVSTRPSNRLKQFWFLSRALAGAICGVRTRTAINLVGSLRPEQVFQESRYAKPARKQRKPKKYE